MFEKSNTEYMRKERFVCVSQSNTCAFVNARFANLHLSVTTSFYTTTFSLAVQDDVRLIATCCSSIALSLGRDDASSSS